MSATAASEEEKKRLTESTDERDVEDGLLAKPKLESFVEEPQAPADKGNLVYWIILLQGLGTLMPWNMFLNIAPDYYANYKMNGTEYQENFSSYLAICSQIPNLLLNLINIFIVIKGDLTKRIGMTLMIVGSVVVFTMAFIYADTSSWTTGFFALTMLSVIVLNGANGVYQNSVFGLASDFPFKFTSAVIIGNNLCGTFVSVIDIVTKSLTNNVQAAAFAYFAIALFTIACCFCSFMLLTKQPFYQFYKQQGDANRAAEATKSGGEPSMADYLATIKQGWPAFLNVYLVFFVTLTIFPGMMLDTSPEVDGIYDFPLPRHMYISITCFLLFNVGAFIGAMLPNLYQKPGPSYLWVFTYGRLVLIPLFAMCNYRIATRGSLPVMFANPWIYLFLVVVMSVSSGYFSSLGMMYAPRSVDASKGRIAGMMAAFFLISGVVSGLCFTMVVKFVVDNI